jgi:glycosyltransferase involved in cell wall biosynthesis
MRTLMSAEFLRRGVDVDLVVLNATGDLLATVPVGVRVVSLEAPRIRHALGPLTRYLRRHAPDALIADTWPLTSVAVAAAELARLPGRVIVVDHNTLSLTPLYADIPTRAAMRATIRLAYPRAAARVAVSHGVADDLAQVGRLDRESIQVIHNAAATGVHPSEDREAHAWTRSTPGPRVLTVGNLKEQKDHATLLRAFRDIRRSGPAQLAIVGDGPLREATLALARDLGIVTDLHMPGFVANVAAWYAGADVFVLSSRFEGFGNVIVEALEHGVPVVSTDCRSGPREILDDGHNGSLVPVGDAPALADAIAHTLRNPPERQYLQHRARDFLVPFVTERYLDVAFPGVTFDES